LFDKVKIGRSVDGAFRDLKDPSLSNLAPARAFADYAITIDRETLPAGIEIIERI